MPRAAPSSGYEGIVPLTPKQTKTQNSLEWGAVNIGAPLVTSIYGSQATFEQWTDARNRIQQVVPGLSQTDQDKLAAKLMKTDLADKMGLKAEVVKDIFKNVSTSAALNAPGTMAYAGVSKADPQLAAALSDAMDFFTSLFGSDQTSAFLSVFAISDKVSREKSLALVKDITGWTPEPHRYVPGQAPLESGAAVSGEVIQAELAKVIEASDPKAAFEALDSHTQAAVWDAANQLMEQAKPLEQAAVATSHILQTGDYSGVWNEDDAKKVDAFVAAARGTWAGGVNELSDIKDDVDAATRARGQKNIEEARLNRMLGVTQVQAIENGRLVIDKEWARQNPDRAVAMKLYLEQTYPDVEIEIGEHGIVAGVLDGLGRVAETIAGPVGAAIHQLGEVVEKLNFGPFGNDTEKNQARLAELKKGLKEGTIKPKDIDSALHEIDNIEEDLHSDLGWQGFVDDMRVGVSAATPGMGFGENFATGIGIHPGDTGYEAVAGVSGLASQIFFDPLNSIFGGIQGWRAGSKFILAEGVERTPQAIYKGLLEAAAEHGYTLPKGGEAELMAFAERLAKQSGIPKVHGWMANRVLNNVIRTPTDMAVTYGFQQAHETLWGALKALGPDAFQDVVVDYVGIEKAALFKTARSKADLSDMIIRSMQGRAGTLPLLDSWKLRRAEASKAIREIRLQERQVQDLLDQYDEIVASRRTTRSAELEDINRELDFHEAKLEDMQAGEDALRTDKAYYNSVIRDTYFDNDLPIPSARDLKRIDKLAGERSAWDEAVRAADETGEAMVVNPKGWQRFYHPFRDIGESKAMAFDHPSLLGSKSESIGILNSVQYFKNFARDLGLTESQIQKLVHPWITGELAGDQNAQFKFWDKLWTDTINASNLDSAVKERINVYFDSRQGLRSGGDILDGGPRPVPANFDQSLLDAEGNLIPGANPSGYPLNTAGEIDFQPRIPSAGQMAELRRFTNRHHAVMAKLGLKPKVIEKGLQNSSVFLDKITNMWKNAVMLPRLIGPLPLRIGLEQQARIWGFGMGRFRPGEWFRFFRKRMSDEEVLLWGEAPNKLMGGHIDDVVRRSKAVPQSSIIKYQDALFSDAVNSALSRWIDSPEFKLWHKDTLGDTEASWAAMMNPKANYYHRKLAEKFFNRYTNELHYEDPKVALANAQKNLTQMIGADSPGARFIRTALENNGRAKNIKGEVVKIGTKQFSEELDRLKNAGEWLPELREIPTGSMNYIPDGTGWDNFKDFMYRWGYTKPDLAASRSPLFRTIATRKFNYYNSLGYSVERSLQLSQEAAARQVADIMFEIGGHTSGEHFIRNIAPFFPAWRELAKTWLVKIPKNLGGLEDAGTHAVRALGWGLGDVRLARRADVIADAATGAGMISEDQYGNTVVGLGSFGDIINGVLGTDFNFHVADFKLDSLFGIFPIPTKIFDEDLSVSERLAHLPPTLGAPASQAFEGLADVTGWKWLRNVQGFVSPFGGDSSFMGANVDNFLMGLGITPPWTTSTTRQYQDAMRLSATMEGMRYFYRDNPPPKRPPEWNDWSDVRRDQWTQNVLAPWAKRMIDAGDHYSDYGYLKKAFWGAISPVTFTQTDEGIEEMSKMWDYLAPFKGTKVYSDVASGVINTFLEEHPEMEAWMTGKYYDAQTDESGDEHTYKDFVESLKAGDVEIKTPEDFAAALYGNASRSLAYRRREQIFKNLKAEPDPVYAYLTQPKWKKRIDAAGAVLDNFDDYMSTVGSLLPNQKTPYTTMRLQLELAKSKRLGEEDTRVTLNQKQQDFVELNDLRDTLDKYVKLDPEAIETERYYTLQQKIAEKTAALYGNEDEFYRAVGHFYDINGDYWDKVNGLYDKLDNTEPADKGLIYNQIRNIKAQYNKPTMYQGHVLPTPEEYAFSIRTPEEQEGQVAGWATLPAEYLTEFERQQVGYSLTDSQQPKAEKLADYAFRVDQAYQEGLNRANKTYDTEAQARADKLVSDYATKLGLSRYWAEANAPNYIRIGSALKLGERTNSWNIISGWATELRRQIESRGYEPQSASGTMQQAAYGWFSTAVQNLHDPELNKILNMLGDQLGPNGRALAPEELLTHLFFDVFVR